MNRPIRVLHTITTLSFGGAETMLYKLVSNTLNETALSQRVLCLSEKAHYSDLLENLHIPVDALDLKRFPHTLPHAAHVFSSIRHWNPSIIVSWLYHADLFSSLAHYLINSRHLIWNIRCSNMNLSDYSILTRFVFNCLRKISHLPTAVVANSEAGKAYHLKAGYHPNRWAVIPNGFDTKRFKPNSGERARFLLMHGIAKDCPIVGMVARFDPMKNHALFFRVARRLVDTLGHARFILIGKGMDQDNPIIDRMIAKYRLQENVILMGVRPDLERIYPAFDLLLSTSSSGEGFPNVIGEAMACGVPVVATDVGDTSRIVGPGGIVVPPGDLESLVGACETLLGLSMTEKKALGQMARNRIIENFSIDSICRQYSDLFLELGSES